MITAGIPYWRFLCWWMCLSILLISELIRKYIIGDNYIVIGGESVTLLLAFVFAARGFPRGVWGLIVIVFLYLFWGLCTDIYNNNSYALFAVGSRAVVVPLSCLVTSIYIHRREGVWACQLIFYRFSSIWLYVIAVVAAFEIYYGPASFLSLGFSFEGVERVSTAQYDADGVGTLSDFFRPRSIFLSTGKAGKIAFILAVYMLYYRTANKYTYFFHYSLVVVEVSILLLVGARSALQGYILAIIVFNLRRRDVLRLLSIVIMITVTALIFSAAYREESSIIFLRALSVVGDVAERFDSNVAGPIEIVLDRYSLFGAGLGVFSLGSSSYGGYQLYEILTTGQAESGFLRVIAEVGIFGFLLYFSLFVAIFLRCWFSRGESFGVGLDHVLYKRYVCFVLAYVILWNVTHDVFGHVLMLSLLFTFMAPLYSGWSRGCRSRDLCSGSTIRRVF